MRVVKYWSLSAIATVLLSGCAPETDVRIVAYKLTVSFDQGAVRHDEHVTNVVRVGKKYNYAPGMSGTGNTCKANATAIPITVANGSILALIEGGAGEQRGFNACKLGRWADKPISEYMRPRFVFLPTGAPLKDAQEVAFDDLGNFGLNRVEISSNTVADSGQAIPSLFKRLGCADGDDSAGYHTPPNCGSLVLRDFRLDN